MKAQDLTNIAMAVARLSEALAAAGCKRPRAVVVDDEAIDALQYMVTKSDGFVTYQNGENDPTTGHFKSRPIVRVVGVEFIAKKQVGKLVK